MADVKGAWYRANSSADSYSDVRGVLYLGGLTAQRRLCNGRIYFGAFFDGGNGEYGTYDYISALAPGMNPAIRGDGDLDMLGGGVFLRRKWNNGFRLDAMFRGGNMKNHFVSHDLITDGLPARFELDNAYWGANIGLTKSWKYGLSEFDVYSRYSWLLEEGDKVVLSTNEVVDFQTLNSHRLISGGRWTRHWNAKWSSYLGGAYEHEFDGATRAVEHVSGSYFTLAGPSLRGGTGVGEVGLIWHSGQRFYATLGVEGYVGKREGGSTTITAMWKW
jgi:hypothetical protein